MLTKSNAAAPPPPSKQPSIFLLEAHAPLVTNHNITDILTVDLAHLTTCNEEASYISTSREFPESLQFSSQAFTKCKRQTVNIHLENLHILPLFPLLTTTNHTAFSKEPLRKSTITTSLHLHRCTLHAPWHIKVPICHHPIHCKNGRVNFTPKLE